MAQKKRFPVRINRDLYKSMQAVARDNGYGSVNKFTEHALYEAVEKRKKRRVVLKLR